MDCAAGVPLKKEVFAAMKPFLYDNFANASGLHFFARRAKAALNSAREKVAEILNCKFEEIIFTSGGTESDNLAILGFCEANLNSQKNKILTTKMEHPAVARAFENLMKIGNAEIQFLKNEKTGEISAKNFSEKAGEKTLFASIIFANNEIGTISEIEKIAKIAREKKVILHSDACQIANAQKLDLQKIDVDFLTLNGAKIGGPGGILFRRKNLKIAPRALGGAQEFGIRAGTEKIADAVGFAAALEIAQKNLKTKNQKFREIQKNIFEFVKNKIPLSRLNGAEIGKKRLPTNLHFSFLNCEGETLALILDEMGFAVSTGSACAAQNLEISPVLKNLKMPHEIAHGSIRISFDENFTAEKVDEFCAALKTAVKKTREISSADFTEKDFENWF